MKTSNPWIRLIVDSIARLQFCVMTATVMLYKSDVVIASYNIFIYVQSINMIIVK